jgi:hemoglobin
MSDPMQPAPPPSSPQPATAFDWVGGEAAVRALVDCFYDLMDLEPAYAGIRSLHPQDMTESRNKLFWFLCGWLGGPAHYVHRFGHPRLRARHLPYAIGMAERDQWMQCMLQALREEGHPEALVERLMESFFNTADWMRNKGG